MDIIQFITNVFQTAFDIIIGLFTLDLDGMTQEPVYLVCAIIMVFYVVKAFVMGILKLPGRLVSRGFSNLAISIGDKLSSLFKMVFRFRFFRKRKNSNGLLLRVRHFLTKVKDVFSKYWYKGTNIRQRQHTSKWFASSLSERIQYWYIDKKDSVQKYWYRMKY